MTLNFIFSSKIRIIYLTYFSYCLDIYKLPCNPQRYTNVEIKRRATGQDYPEDLDCVACRRPSRSLSLDLEMSHFTHERRLIAAR